jgi:hypothetical protein
MLRTTRSAVVTAGRPLLASENAVVGYTASGSWRLAVGAVSDYRSDAIAGL